MNSTMEKQKIQFSSGFLSFCLEENLRCLGGYKLNMAGDLFHLRGSVNAVLADIRFERRVQQDDEYLAECLGIVNNDLDIGYWFAISAKRIYIFEWNGLDIGSDLFSDISQKINGNFFVKEEGKGLVLANSELCCGRSYIIFRRLNYVGEDKRIYWGRSDR